MTLFTLEGLCRGVSIGSIIDEIRRSYLDWLTTQVGSRPGREVPGGLLAGYECLRHARAPGTTCIDSLRKGGLGSIAQPANDRKGCGAVMRTAPIGFLDDRWDDRAVFRLAAEAGALTHGHPDGYLPGGAMALLVRGVLDGMDWHDVAARVVQELVAWPGHEPTLQILQATVQVADSEPTRARLASLGEGWVGEEALAMGLYAAMSTDSFERCIELAANHSGDSDSTASIAGQLYGARHGLAVIPLGAANRLDVLEPLAAVFSTWQKDPG